MFKQEGVPMYKTPVSSSNASAVIASSTTPPAPVDGYTTREGMCFNHKLFKKKFLREKIGIKGEGIQIQSSAVGSSLGFQGKNVQ